MRLKEARLLARSLRTRQADWLSDPHDWLGRGNLLIHRPTGWALWIGGGLDQLQPFNPHATTPGSAWLHPRRYGVIERLIIWFGGARRWYRFITKRPRRRAQFKGDA